MDCCRDSDSTVCLRTDDPSGPLLDEQGNWHTWEDAGAWSHWVSKDLIHWKGDFKTSTHFGGDTGSVSPTPSGVYAFWPIMGGPGKGSIGSAKSKDPSSGMTQWDQRGPTIPMPSRINAGFRDPVRAFEYPEGSDQWCTSTQIACAPCRAISSEPLPVLHLLRLALHLECALTPPPHAGVGVGGGNKPGCETSALAPSCGAQFCLFKAKDNTLSNFTDAGSMYTTNETFGLVDSNIVWQPTNTSANMMECPDFFPLGSGGKHVLIGSLYKTNQWWIGTVAGNPPRFTPESVGIVDYGNGYAAKTGSTWKQTGASRRLVFVSPATVCCPHLSTRASDAERCCNRVSPAGRSPPRRPAAVATSSCPAISPSAPSPAGDPRCR